MQKEGKEMSIYSPSAQEAKQMTDDAIFAAKQVATEKFIGDTLVAIANAAKAQQFRYSVNLDGSLINLERVRNVLEAQLGYTIIIPDVNAMPTPIVIDWQSVQREQISVPNSLNVNPKFNAN